jgi:ribonuclease P protein component
VPNGQGRAAQPRQDFPRAIRLVKRTEYEAVYGAGQRRSSPHFTIFYRVQPAILNELSAPHSAREDAQVRPAEEAVRPASRFGISVKKALGGAVVRNRIRRRIREILRRNKSEIPSGWDIVIHPRRSVAEEQFAPLEAELVRLLRSLGNSKPSA